MAITLTKAAAGRGVAAVRVAASRVDDGAAGRVAVVGLTRHEVAPDLRLEPELRAVVVVQRES